jgi:flagellar protein FlbD
MDDAMITLTRLNGAPFALNCDLIERVEATPDTIITLVDGKHFVVVEPVEFVIRAIRVYRASVIVSARELEGETAPIQALRLLPDDREE